MPEYCTPSLFPSALPLHYFKKFFFSLYISGGASVMGQAYIRARKSGRGRWCRFLHGIVPGRDAPGSEPTTPLNDARGSRGCTLAVQSVGAYACIHRGINPVHAFTPTSALVLDAEIWRARRFARDIRDDESGTRGHNTEPFITRLWPLFRVAYTRHGTMAESVTCPLRVFLFAYNFARSRPAFTTVKIS